MELFDYSHENLLPHSGAVFYFPHFFSPKESDSLFHTLQTEVPWQQESIKIFGKIVPQPRLSAFYGDTDKPYTYSGLTLQAHAWSGALLQIKTAVEKVSKVVFTSALLNYYRDGNDSMGWHRDNEKELGYQPTIASVSFGATRTFQLREYSSKQNQRSIDLQHGSLLLMQGDTQHNWEHRVPKATRIQSPRLNITFRVILPL
ncbi:alkylated DNA repair dioxygenase AlkB [Chitinophaga skermanii]|uniref:Alkylated DNA repair dioxygenase AlkB n=1 Tax=Chitinophaga skermanii TaxID=331697 RepID=A0A327R0Z4_9BACT|nr:alpha-ketoglutarate-dependent dioxygenase AlkB [Chitinophaga skermanii]RAJ10556.1 alkylated DNA repair dioxygenase AlkB [Chitinophaga skermanii]